MELINQVYVKDQEADLPGAGLFLHPQVYFLILTLFSFTDTSIGGHSTHKVSRQNRDRDREERGFV